MPGLLLFFWMISCWMWLFGITEETSQTPTPSASAANQPALNSTMIATGPSDISNNTISSTVSNRTWHDPALLPRGKGAPYYTALSAMSGFPEGSYIMCSGRVMKPNFRVELACCVDRLVRGWCLTSRVPAGRAQMWRCGHTQVYVCNEAPFTPNRCDAGEVRRADAMISALCGSHGGWLRVPSWLKSIGRDPTEDDGAWASEC